MRIARLQSIAVYSALAAVLAAVFPLTALGAADLALTKTNNVGGSVPFSSPTWTWTWQLTNVGDVPITYNGAELIFDALPDTNISYTIPTTSQNANFTGSVSCTIGAGPGFTNLNCSGNVTINPGGTLTVNTTATAVVSGTFTNPRPSGNCFHGDFAGGDGSPADTNPANNNCSDTVLVTSPNADLSVTKSNNVSGSSTPGGSWNWTLLVSNSAAAGASANFANGTTILTDNLPSASISYGAVSVSSGGGTTGTVNCSIASSNLTCTASGAVSLPPGGTVTVTVPATASAELIYANPRTGGVCLVDPSLLITEASEANNTCNNSVSTTMADMVATKTNNIGGSTTLGSPTWTWTIQLQNVGTLPKTYNGFFFTDNLPNTGLTYGSPAVSLNANVSGTMTCTINASSNLTCQATNLNFTNGGIATITFTATATSSGVFGNPRSGGVCYVENSAGSPTEPNNANNFCSDAVTVLSSNPDLTVVKTNNTAGQSYSGGSWTWTLAIANSGGAATAAVFTNGQTILTDNLPNSGITYSTPAVVTGGGTTGTINCSIASANLTCTASGSVSLPAGGTITVSIPAAATAEAVHANPRSGGVCAVDPGSVITEAQESNNGCSDSVSSISGDMTIIKTNNVGGSTTLASPTWTWTLQAQNIGSLAKVFANASTIISDELPNTNVSYGSPVVTTNGNVTGNIICAITSSNLLCTALAGPVTFNAGGIATVTFTATATAIGSYANPRSGGTCAVDGLLSTPADANNTNNTCTDIVTVLAAAPDLTVVKSNDTGGQSSNGGTWTWTLAVSNAAGSSPASFSNGAVILTDNLPNTAATYGVPIVTVSGGTTGAVNCAIAGSDLSCTASGGVAIPAAGTVTVAVPVTAGAEQVYANPRSGGICAVDPNLTVAELSDSNNTCSNSVSTQTADLTVMKTNDVAGSASLAAPHWTWTFLIQNGGTLPKSFTGGTQILVDNLPDTNITYSAPNVVVNASVSGTIACAVNATSNLVCSASGAVVINSGGIVTVTLAATATAAGTFANPRAGGICAVSGSLGTPADRNSANDSCADSVVVAMFGAAPAVSKAFNPATIAVGVPTTLTITLSNPNVFPLTGVGFADTYPAGLVNTAAPSGATTCGSGVVTAAPDGTTLTLANGTIPASGSCTVTVSVIATTAGTLVNVLPPGSVTTGNALAGGGASGALNATRSDAPTLSWPALLSLAAVLAIAGWLVQRR